MKNLVLITVLVLIAFNLSAAEKKKYRSLLKMRGQEIVIQDSEVNEFIYNTMDLDRVELSLVAGHYCKYDEFIFCENTTDMSYRCSFYIDLIGDGHLSSYYTDHDFGKSDLVDYIENKDLQGKAKFDVNSEGVIFWIEGPIAKRIYAKMPGVAGRLSVVSSVSYHYKEGQHFKCWKNKKNSICQITVPVQFKKQNMEQLKQHFF